MMRRIGSALYAVWSFFFLIQFLLNTLLLGLFVTLITFLTTRRNFVYRVGGFWSRLNLALTGVKVTVSGMENIEADQPYVVMANHQSLYDVWALIGYLPMQLRWVIKFELRRVPVFGLGCHRMGHIFIQRGVSEQARTSLEEAAAKIRNGTSVFFFPEGTRSPDGRLLKFKRGGFHVAQVAGVPILPITVNGGIKILRRSSLWLRPGRMEIIIHPAVAMTEGEGNANRNLLLEEVRATIERDLRVT